MTLILNITTIKRLLSAIQFVKKDWWIWFGAKIYDCMQGILEPWIAAWIISAVAIGNKQWIVYGAIALLIIKVIQQIFAIIATASGVRVMGGMEYFLASQFFGKYLYFDNNRTESIGTGKMNGILSRWTNAWINVVYDIFPNLIAEIITIAVGFVIIFISVPIFYSVLLLILFTISMGLMAFAQKEVLSSRKEAVIIVNEVQRKWTQIIMSKFEIFQNNKLGHELAINKSFTEKLTTLLVRSKVIVELFNWGAATMMMIVQAWVYIIIGVGVIHGDYEIGTLALLTGLTMTVYKYFWNIQRSIDNYNRYMVSVDQFLDTMDNTPLVQTDNSLPPFEFKSGNIELKNLAFAYESSKEIFSDFSLSLAGGKKYAFVGPSWGGKTTLIKLIAGYIHPTSGNVSVDGQRLSDISLQSYYHHIGYLTQEPNVFDGKILENLTYALSEEELKSDKLQSRIDEVIKLAKCEFIHEFEHGLETEIGERGVKLSGWQKQRLAIAKIMLKNPEIILLDEPTSALDSINEESITEALHNLFQGRTVIVVAHRLQTVKQADTIFYIEDGKVLEQGSHDELVSRVGKYKKMLDLQSGF
jgi:ATP-binding cassette subfamily B protein AbcA/BmrA